MAEDPQVVQRLDTLIALFKLAFSDKLSEARNKIQADPLMLALLEHADGRSSGEIVKAAAAQAQAGTRTAEARLADLVAMGAIRGSRAGNKTTYQNSGLF